MEKHKSRKVQSLGRSLYISVPAAWAFAYDLQKGSTMQVFSEGSRLIFEVSNDAV